MGQYAYKKELLTAARKTLTEQLVADLRLVPERHLLAFANRCEGGWHHKDKFLKNAKRLMQPRGDALAQDAADVVAHLPWAGLSATAPKDKFLGNLKETIAVLGGPRVALICLIRNAAAEKKEDALPPEAFTECAQAGKAVETSPDRQTLHDLLVKVGAKPAAPLEEEAEKVHADRSSQKLKDELDRVLGARERELNAERRHHANEAEGFAKRIAALNAELSEERAAHAEAQAALNAALLAAQAKAAALEQDNARLKGEVDQGREQVARRAREIAEELLSEELRPWFADARRLRAAAEEVARIRELTTDEIEKARKVQRDADPFLAKEHELRQALPQMEEMRKLILGYQGKAGKPVQAFVDLQQRITEHIDKVRHTLDGRDGPSDPTLARLLARINAAEIQELKPIEAAVLSAEQAGLLDSRHADLCRRKLHERRSYLADSHYHEQKQVGPLALLERAIAVGEKARLGLDANNFACLQQTFLGLKLPSKKNPQGEARFIVDLAARQRLIALLEKLADDGTGLHLWACFDGQTTAPKIANGRVRMLTSRAGAKADHDLMDLVAKDKTLDAPWFIVSDDAEVRDACQRQGAHIINNEALVRLLSRRGIRV
jgi:hypothetical protein